MGPRFSLLAFLAAGCTFTVRPIPPANDLALPDLAPAVSLDLATLDLVTPSDLTELPTLAAERADAPASVDLTGEGTLDWAHFGLYAPGDVNRKKDGSAAIQVVQMGNGGQYGYYGLTCSWSNGAPTASATTMGGVYINGVGNGFVFTVPAVASPRTLRLYLTNYQGTGTISAHLDGTTDYTDALTTSANKLVRYTLAFRSPAGGSLQVNWKITADTGTASVDLLAATLY